MKLIACINNAGYLDFQAPKTDLQRFQALTVGGRCWVGRVTWETLPPAAKRNRKWVVVSRSADKTSEEKYLVHPDIAPALTMSDHWLCGGARLYSLLYPQCDMVYLSRCCGDSGKVLFPQTILSNLHGEQWERIVKQDHSDHTFEIYKKRN